MTEPTAPTLAGNVPDPDATVLDSLVEQAAEPPTPAELPRGWAKPLTAPKRPTRLLTGAPVILPTWKAVLLLPADVRRTRLQLAATGTALDVVRVADDPGKLETAASSYSLPAGGPALALDGHTGPVWYSAPDAADSVTVSYAAVTE